MTLIQILILIFVAFAGSRAVLRFRDRIIGYGEFFFWSAIWTIVLLIIFRPSLSDDVASLLGISRGTDVMFFAAIIVLFYLIFRLYVKLNSLDRDITALAINTSKAFHQRKE